MTHYNGSFVPIIFCTTFIILALSLAVFGIISAIKADNNIPYSNVTCNLSGLEKSFNHVQVHYCPQSWCHDMWFTYEGVTVNVQDTYCIVETAVNN